MILSNYNERYPLHILGQYEHGSLSDREHRAYYTPGTVFVSGFWNGYNERIIG